ncbi:cupin domain-containing protein [Ruegeria sp. 2205SS24-7]|uniref:cupin domain-containing protein n=1 Tax=Ruegeria discodermiae TaxID=3064389 RepID=UPI0027417799|nr:cupin domain-containing protein [Ruegeria sp. 2205SS24-7]MDP5219902.1 cupin domain-containing protein [Ruegeria sp. 2205SS24-7]
MYHKKVVIEVKGIVQMTQSRPRTYHLLGNLLKFHAFPAETGNRCTIVEIKSAPGAGAPPNHHAGEDESFYVLDGEFEFLLNDETKRVTSGDFVKVPDGAIHAFTCIGQSPGRLLCINAPGAMHDTFFTEAGEAMPDGTTDIPIPDGPPDIPAIMAVAKKVGMTILAPEGAPV